MKDLIKQHHAITEARYDLSAIEKNLLYMLLAKIDDNVPEAIDKVRINIEIEELENRVKQKISFEKLEKISKRMVTRSFEIQTDEVWTWFSIVSSFAFDEKTGIIELGISKGVYPYVFQLKKEYTTEFLLDMVLSLRSKYSKRLYEMLCQHANKGRLHISVDELRARLGLNPPHAKQPRYGTWTQFETAILKRPVEEITTKTDLYVRYDLERDGKKFTGVRFRLYKKDKQMELGFPHSSSKAFTSEQKIAKRMLDEGLPLSQVSRLTGLSQNEVQLIQSDR